ncbi:nitroreductase family protein [Clostridium sp. AM58-1XD]|uniref:nitroreductase family protein n=1 Tax=Clostridium sp. AM58-1XD TaxID=2292307 RepID=UPI0015F4A133|nr:nitroreductase family protein [Clostridium sp. AM58-1XD]
MPGPGAGQAPALKELCVYPEGTAISPDIAAILQAARLAPSSFNSQPWRFVVRHDKIHVFACHNKIAFSDLGRFQEFNIGIVLSHIVLAAEEQWVTAETVREEGLSEKEYKNGKYICTVRLH